MLDLLIVTIIWEGEDTKYTYGCTQYMHCQVSTGCRGSYGSSGDTDLAEKGVIDIGVDEQVTSQHTDLNIFCCQIITDRQITNTITH